LFYKDETVRILSHRACHTTMQMMMMMMMMMMTTLGLVDEELFFPDFV
jgi:hypothetical protein